MGFYVRVKGVLISKLHFWFFFLSQIKFMGNFLDTPYFQNFQIKKFCYCFKTQLKKKLKQKRGYKQDVITLTCSVDTYQCKYVGVDNLFHHMKRIVLSSNLLFSYHDFHILNIPSILNIYIDKIVDNIFDCIYVFQINSNISHHIVQMHI